MPNVHFLVHRILADQDSKKGLTGLDMKRDLASQQPSLEKVYDGAEGSFDKNKKLEISTLNEILFLV